VFLSDASINGTRYNISTGADIMRVITQGSGWIRVDRKVEINSPIGAYAWFNVTMYAGKDYVDLTFQAVNAGSNVLELTDVGFGFGSMNEFLQYNPRYVWVHLADGRFWESDFDWFLQLNEHHAWTSYNNGSLVDLIGVSGYRTPEVAKGYVVKPMNVSLMREVNYQGELYGNGTRIVYSPQYANPPVQDQILPGGTGKTYEMLCIPLGHMEYDKFSELVPLYRDYAQNLINYDLSMSVSSGIPIYALARYANMLPEGSDKTWARNLAKELWNWYYSDLTNRIERSFYRSTYALACAGLELDPANSTYVNFASDCLNFAFSAQIMDSANPEHGLMGWSLEDHGWTYLCASLYDSAIGSNSTIENRMDLISSGIQYDTSTDEIYMKTLNDDVYNISKCVGFWKLDEPIGNIIHDWTVHCHAGTIYGNASHSDGKFRKGIQFFDSTAYISIPNFVGDMNTSSLDVRDSITLEAWVYPTSFSGVNRIITKDGDVYVLRLDNGKPEFYIKVNGSLYFAESNTPLPLNDWSFVSATWQGSGDDLYLHVYVNGVEVDYMGEPHDWVSGQIDVSSGGVFLSKDGTEAFIGKLDQVRIWSRELAQSELQYNYQLGLNSNWIKHTSNSLTADTNFRGAELIYTFMTGGFSGNDLTQTCILLFIQHVGVVPGYPGKAFGRPSWSNTETDSDCLSASLKSGCWNLFVELWMPILPLMGTFGFIMMCVSLVYGIEKVKNGEFLEGSAIALLMFLIGFAFIVGWLWSV
jgi:hypothetical protein